MPVLHTAGQHPGEHLPAALPAANCQSCAHPIRENFCGRCGQAARLPRIDRHYLWHELLHLLHFEKGFFFTVWELLVRPGLSVREFIAERRSRHMKPVAFLILASLIYTVVTHWLHADVVNNSKEQLNFGSSSINAIQHWVQTHYGYANILMGILIALFVRLFFRRYPYNFFEALVLLCFVMAQGMLLLTAEALFVNVLSQSAYQVILSAISLLYPTWAIGQFFDQSKVSSYVKGLFSYFLGYLLFYVLMVGVGLTADVVLHYAKAR